jgi:hypothetical protein
VPLTTRGRRQVARTLFPGNYWVYRQLALRVPEGGVVGEPIPFTQMARLAPLVASTLQQNAQRDRAWQNFDGVDADHIDLMQPATARVDVAPTTWWCTNCGVVYNGALNSTGIHNGRCPRCEADRIVQFASFFMCGSCHRIQPVEPSRCAECGDSRNVILRAQAGRRRDYRWRCTVHADWNGFVGRTCSNDGTRMTLKSAGGRTYYEETIQNIHSEPRNDIEPVVIGPLRFSFAAATVATIVVGRKPVADLAAYYRRAERPRIEPFVNPQSGRYGCFVSILQTDAITLTGAERPLTEIEVHSLEHGLLNAVPAVTGLVQDEFGADHSETDLTLYDDVMGGTGGCRLLIGSRMQRWLAVARELAECHQVECDSACRGCLFLPSRLCREGNDNLDRFSILPLFPA